MTGASANREALRTPQGERTRRMRARILSAAIDLLRDKGYAAFRVAEVADAAGVSRGAQLHHFPTKDALVAACLEQVFSVAHEKAAHAANRVMEDDRILESACADAEAFFYGEDFLIALDLVIAGNKLDPLADDVRHMSQRQRIGAEQAWVSRFANTGLSADEAEDILWVLWSVLRGLAVRAQIGRDPERVRRVTELTVKLLEEYTAKIKRLTKRSRNPPNIDKV
ncbi:TetR/AcrR family transcriptional regulator [Novosphingobium sp. Gsoil 351]|uniref:TetR/AcrR family transcriptional regulator n=1 Tax=Novosphingobium sp. Gsoil 351 TaxID=2675225 RepID=UPI0018A80100|nr:TetR/AcrR family transcriptional regulator [Novosphingobium sp. Gsoil 351]